MKKPFKVGKAGIIIVSLLFLNVVVFASLSSKVKRVELDSHQMTTQHDDNYFKSGIDVLNWTYTLYKYFNK